MPAEVAMGSLSSVFSAALTYIKAYVNMLNEHWITQCFLYLVLLDIIVTSIIYIRGSK